MSTPWTIFLTISTDFELGKMPIIKHFKAEKVSTETLAQKAMDVCREMLAIMCERSNKDGEDESIYLYLSMKSSHEHIFHTSSLFWNRSTN